MSNQFRSASLISVAAATIALTFSINASAAVDVEAAKMLARENNCFKCHGVEKEKDGPAYKKVAEKYRGKAGAEERLFTHVTSGEKAKFPDGHEEEHKNIQGKASPEAIKNLVGWILSL
ncbi:MAG: c-type cytochrome [Sideroxydans sp.]|nr:c-type cytochrome [Sideroxydans sp.]